MNWGIRNEISISIKFKDKKRYIDLINFDYDIVVNDIEEYSDATEPNQYVMDLSRNKANCVANKIDGEAIILAADSIIYMDNEKFEKPKTKEQAYDNIKRLSGKVNYAVTGVTIKDLYNNKEISFT